VARSAAQTDATAIDEGYVWDVTFSGASVRGNVPTLTLASNDLGRNHPVSGNPETADGHPDTDTDAIAVTAVDGNYAGFRLKVDDKDVTTDDTNNDRFKWTRCIAYDESDPAVFRARIGELTGATNERWAAVDARTTSSTVNYEATIVRSDLANGYQHDITFAQPANPVALQVHDTDHSTGCDPFMCRDAADQANPLACANPDSLVTIGSENLGGSFKLTVDAAACTLCDPADLPDPSIPVQVDVAGGSTNFAAQLNTLWNTGSAVNVVETKRAGVKGDEGEGFTWSITFQGLNVEGDVPNDIITVSQQATSGDGVVIGTGDECGIAASTFADACTSSLNPIAVTEGRELSGDAASTFALSADFRDSVPPGDALETKTGIKAHATAANVLADLISLNYITGVEVTPAVPAYTWATEDLGAGSQKYGGFTWTITFTQNDGDIADFTCDKSNVKSTQMVATGQDDAAFTAAAACDIVTVEDGLFVKPGSTFTLGHANADSGTTETATIAWDADAVTVKARIESLFDTETVAVEKSATTPTGDSSWSGGYTWTVEYLDHKGDVDLLSVVDQSAFVDTDDDTNNAVVAIHHASSLSSSPAAGVEVNGNQVTGRFRLEFDHYDAAGTKTTLRRKLRNFCVIHNGWNDNCRSFQCYGFSRRCIWNRSYT
jgi:hypothetical protein